MKLSRLFLVIFGSLVLITTACAPEQGGGGSGGTTTTAAPSGAPIALASASPTVGDAPLVVEFDSWGSTPGFGTDLTYSWDFGDGTAPGTNESETHTYTTPGIYQAQLTMENSEGTSKSPKVTITVNVDPNPKYYVRTTGTDSAECGPLADPCKTITTAQANAVADGIHNIRVAGGTYAPLTLVSNMNIEGGWEQNFSDVGVGEVTNIYGTGTTPAVTINSVSDSTLERVNAMGVQRTSGDAVGILIDGGSNNVTIKESTVAGGIGPNATGILVKGGSNTTISKTSVNSGTPTGAGSSAYGVRALELSNVNLVLSNVVAQPGVAGVDAPSGTPAQAASGNKGGNGANASGPSSPGGGGAAGSGANNGGAGGRGGDYSGSGAGGSKGSGPAGGNGGSGGCGSLFGCGGDANGGNAGGAGAAGVAGQAGSNTPVAGPLWTSTNGKAGTAGQAGSGGGGGGGGKSASASGGGGGGGGAGGAGGAAGTVGGTSGGGSFGVYASGASVNLSSSTVQSSAGGKGGNGANGGRGGNGGNGGDGGNKSCCEAGGGGGGGAGGAGGGGGGAGGGAGGPSIAVYHVGVGTVTNTASNFSRPALPATGGTGGAFSSPATGGIGGARGNCALIGGCANGEHDGQTAGVGNLGPAGANGPAGQLFRVWDNGTTTP